MVRQTVLESHNGISMLMFKKKKKKKQNEEALLVVIWKDFQDRLSEKKGIEQLCVPFM